MTSGNVAVTSRNLIATLGDFSHGIQAQSVGGGGGNAGLVENKIVSLKDGTMAWHLAGMAVAMASMAGHGSDHGGGHGDMGHAMAPAPAMLAIAWIGIPFMIALLVMGVTDLIGCLRPATTRAERPHRAMGAAMNLGMFWMSVGLVAPPIARTGRWAPR